MSANPNAITQMQICVYIVLVTAVLLKQKVFVKKAVI